MKADWYSMSFEQLHERLCAVLEEIKLRNVSATEQLQVEVGTKKRNAEHEPIRLCVLGDEQHCQEARALGEHYMDVDDLKDLHQDPRRVDSLAKGYDVFLATDSLIPEIPNLLPGFYMRREPKPVSHEDSLEDKIRVAKEETQAMHREVLLFRIDIGNVSMSAVDLAREMRMSVAMTMEMLTPDFQNIVTMNVILRDRTRYSLL